MIPEISVQELKKLIDEKINIFILDVRNPNEHAICRLTDHLIPLHELLDRINELNKDHHIVVHCHGGGRSRRATELLMQHGFKQVFNLRGGITAWANEIDLSMPRY